jgi:pimeloyl-ACP methyl ester carboxylesterase
MNSLKVRKENIILMGQSIGTGVVMSYAHKHNWTNPIILVSPYKSIVAVATNSCSTMTQYIDKFPSLKYIKEMDCPIKIFHGIDDKLIPISHGMDLDDANPNKTFKPTWMEGVGHNGILEIIQTKDLLEVVNYKKN